MNARLTSALLALALLFSSAPLAAYAQADSGQIVITVTDSTAAKAPVPLARVLLEGPVMTSEYSGSNGAVKFTDVPDGIYQARVFKRGYQSVTSNQFEVSNGHVISVAIVLAAVSSLKEIGSITVHSSATITTSSVSDSSAQRKLSGTLADALNKLSGVSVSTTSGDSDATQTVSLQGQDVSQTSLTLDGIPLNAPGSAGNLGQMSQDLFRGASVSMGPQSGGLAGGVNFRTLEPTLAWQGTASLSAGSYGKYNWSIGETGTLGKFGIALEHTSRTTPSLAYGMVFKDASGLTYAHDAQNQNIGDLLKVRMRIGNSQTVMGTYLDSNVANDLICLQNTGALPCGYGPGNTAGSHFQLHSLSDSALVGETALQGSIFQTSIKADRNLLNRLLNGIPDPTGSYTDTTSRGFSLSALLPARERHTLSISATSVSTSTTISPLIASALFFNNGSRTSHYSSITLNDTIQSSTKLRLNERIGLSQATNSPASLLGGISASWTPTSNDSYTASYSLGGVAAHAGPPGNFSDPSSLRFDCNGNIAYGNAPGDTPGGSSSTDARVSWSHKLRSGVINTSVHRQVQAGVVLPTQVNGTAISGFPAGYFNAVQTVFDSPAGCGSPGAAFGAQNVYFSVPVGGVRRVYQGASIAGSFNVGNLNLQPYYDITQAQAISGDARINNPYSIITSGAQLPNTPLHKAGLTLDYKAPHSAIESLLTAQYMGVNNSQNLPAYTIVDAGIDAHLT
ncbi:MAG: TonB-dependent receptor, partial [Candidatus Eremiobacteraeota bacterium]|nr:TonB-dependent receptor [Candidatus Eremiobacteraeota bacterium]